MLKNPSLTITYLPFYYYYPNFGSIDMSSSRMKKITSWCIGLDISFSAYQESADGHQMELWSRNCKWPVMNKQIARRLDKFDPSTPECSETLRRLSELWDKGAFADAESDTDTRSVATIRRFIGK